MLESFALPVHIICLAVYERLLSKSLVGTESRGQGASASPASISFWMSQSFPIGAISQASSDFEIPKIVFSYVLI